MTGSVCASEPELIKDAAIMPKTFTFEGENYLVGESGYPARNSTIYFDIDNDGVIETLVGFQGQSQDEIRKKVSFLVFGELKDGNFIINQILNGNQNFEEVELKDIDGDGLFEIIFWSSDLETQIGRRSDLAIYEVENGKLVKVFEIGNQVKIDAYFDATPPKINTYTLNCQTWEWDGEKFNNLEDLDKRKEVIPGRIELLKGGELSENAYSKEPRVTQIESTQLSNTDVTSYMEKNIESGRNLLYCSTFQIAWDELTDEIIKEPIMLDGNPLTAQLLNKRLTGKQDISENSYIAMVGFNYDGIVERIRKALKEKFNTEPGIDISLELRDDILAYAFLFKDLKFDKEFKSLEEPILFNGTIQIIAFGIGSDEDEEGKAKLRKQVKILDYKNDNDFILSLISSAPEDMIILAKISPKTTLLETIDHVLERIANSQPTDLHENENLKIPKLDFDIFHRFSDLEEKYFLNNDFQDYLIVKAIQSIRFRLNEKGALLRSEASIWALRGGVIASWPPRSFIFNKQFLILLKEKNTKYPYFAMWIDNAELLLKE